MTPELLRRVGRALYGRVYKRAFSEDLGVHERTVRRWLNGQFNIPDGITVKCLKLVESRADLLDGLAEEIESDTDAG